MPWLREVQNQTFSPVPVRLSPEDLVDFPVEVSVGIIPGFGYASAQNAWEKPCAGKTSSSGCVGAGARRLRRRRGR